MATGECCGVRNATAEIATMAHAALYRVESKIVLGSGVQRMIAMTCPLTKSELELAAAPLVVTPIERRTGHDVVPQFLIAAVYRGIALGICIAAFTLVTDSFGIFTLVTAQPHPSRPHWSSSSCAASSSSHCLSPLQLGFLRTPNESPTTQSLSLMRKAGANERPAFVSASA
jgi:hypothetical protein